MKKKLAFQRKMLYHIIGFAKPDFCEFEEVFDFLVNTGGKNYGNDYRW